MGMFSLVLLSTSVGLTLGFISGGILKVAGLVTTDVFWMIVQGCGVIGLTAGTLVVLRIRFQKDTGTTGSADEEAQM
jgi:hypothetical protein